MPTAKHFEDLIIWQEARTLTKKTYEAVTHADWGLANQMRRAAVSIMSNIAEGFERGGNKEFVHFLFIAKASCGELRSQLYVLLDMNFVSKKQCDDLQIVARKLSIKISNLIGHLKEYPEFGVRNNKTKADECFQKKLSQFHEDFLAEQDTRNI